jgi:ATP-dependent DNA helicase RecG
VTIDHADLTLNSVLASLPAIGQVRAKKLRKIGLSTVRDLMFLFPRDYEFPAPPMAVNELREGEPASLVGTIADAEIVSRTAGKSVFGAIVENQTGAVRILFFNQPFRAETLKLDRRVMISGTAKLNGLRMEFVHPQVTILGDDEDTIKPRILPVYPLTEGIKQIEMRRMVWDVAHGLFDSLTEVMPPVLRRDAAIRLSEIGIDVGESLPEIGRALSDLHRPPSEASLLAARTRLVFQELLVMQLALAIKRRRLTTELRAPPLPSPAMVDARIVNRFPFALTGDQRRTIDEIRSDMACQFPMNRLLQGDVGSGKTIVAIYAMMLAVANEHQAVLMAPTEVLARQHFQTLSETLQGSRVRIGLLCGSLTASEKRTVIEQIGSGQIDLLVGTQALLYGEIDFKRLGVCVIDEQHKFGVAQRVKLRSGGIDPHYLVMSATPIPRSVAMTMFGDVELSTLREKPPGRGTVNTYLGRGQWKERWWAFVRERLDEGRQAFVVAPRVSASEALGDDDEPEDVASVETVMQELTTGPLKNYRVGLLHGRMPNEDKQAVMQQFASEQLQVLVSTTVIEVGINVPNATVMTILGAQRFGLAQLHQLRGRVSRGAHAGHVCVFTDGEIEPEENERLKVLEETHDGFELAEADFRMRGPGDLLGRRQSGLPPMWIADLVKDVDILALARSMAQEMIEEDPELSDDDWTALRDQVFRRYAKRLDLGDVA